jgi:hypothetical protein
MNKNDVVNEVARLMTAALNAAPGEVRDMLRTEAPGVVKSLATMATSAPKSSDRKWAFTTFFGLIRGTLIRDTALQNAIARRTASETEKILANTKKIAASTDARKAARRHRADVAKALRVLAAAKKVGNDATT